MKKGRIQNFWLDEILKDLLAKPCKGVQLHDFGDSEGFDNHLSSMSRLGYYHQSTFL
ncbi:hypothetical protein DPMN_189229 [Dreissena polymorpha]|uniref:Uncharacterized protein n=1 Tax=Dreissena polymorpha TaxID=45954 RepID=A0A9D4IC47_DREPO|nr:hypothetical protein DPMN_189229 [Dreissena polymorpha]